VSAPNRAADYAERALRAHAAMRRFLARPDGAYRRDGRAGAVPYRLGAIAHLWPSARALVSTLDVAGIEPALRPDFDAHAEIAHHLAAVERYWDEPSGRPPGYASDPSDSRFGGDRYHDDNAWVGLALIQLERLRRAGLAVPPAPGTGALARAEQIWRFAVAGWDRSPSPRPGGVFWVEQGRGLGTRNHDRNAVSSAPNAEVGLHLAELGIPIADAAVGPEQMFSWVARHLDAGGDGNGPFRDKIRGDGSVDTRLWSYNQGSMAGVATLFARRAAAAGDADRAAAWSDRAEAIAGRALQAYAGAAAFHDPPEFMAILFRNLLPLDSIRGRTGAFMRAYADVAWDRWRDGSDRFRIPGRGFTLLGQSAMVQILALLAWEPDRHVLLA
jgi:hypothetical protein